MSIGSILQLVCGPMLEACLLAVLLYRQVWRLLPFFCIWIALSLVCDAAIFFTLMQTSSELYTRVYEIESAADAILKCLVLVEIAWSVSRPVLAGRSHARFVLDCLIVLAAIGIWPTAAAFTPNAMEPLVRLCAQMQETVTILCIVWLVGTFCFSQIFSLGWEDHELQVALGLGSYSIVTLSVVILHATMFTGGPVYHWLDQAETISYFTMFAYWIYCISRKRSDRLRETL